jgi:hypothetical protein
MISNNSKNTEALGYSSPFTQQGERGVIERKGGSDIP